jgi:DNA-binding transcriptional ArsR family regulator
MVKHSQDASAQLSAIFAALADPTRRAILERLANDGASVTELAEPFHMSLPAVSKHLRVLERAGLLQRRVDGRTHRIGLATEPLREAARWLEEHRKFWEPRLDRLVAYLEQPEPKEKAAWPRRTPAPKSRSGSSGRSPRRPRRSSKHGRRPKP